MDAPLQRFVRSLASVDDPVHLICDIQLQFYTRYLAPVQPGLGGVLQALDGNAFFPPRELGRGITGAGVAYERGFLVGLELHRLLGNFDMLWFNCGVKGIVHSQASFGNSRTYIAHSL